MNDSSFNSLMELLDPPKGFKPWHGGASLMGSLRGVDHIAAAWKPDADRHSIWELALHIAYWKYAVRRYLDPEAEQGFPRTPANWAAIMDPSSVSWEKDKLLVKEEHMKLIGAIDAFPKERLEEKISGDKEWTFSQLIVGIAAHDVYHIGQIQLMKRLYASRIKRKK